MGWFTRKEKTAEAPPPAESPVDLPAPEAAAASEAEAEDEEYDIMPDELMAAIAKIKGRPAPLKAERTPLSICCPITTAFKAEERRKEAARKKAEEEALKNPQPGQKMPDGTIYLGQYKPKDRAGESLSKTFNVFAAPQDLPETMKYVDAVKHIAGLKSWNGYNGTNYATDKEIYAALKDGSYNGGWIIPTRDILHGKDVDGKETTPDNIFAHKDKGAFKGTFKTASASGSDYPDWYWSSTEDRDDPSFVWGVRLSGGDVVWHHKDNGRLSCRPVRLVEAPAL